MTAALARAQERPPEAGGTSGSPTAQTQGQHVTVILTLVAGEMIEICL
ncbi:hypothetical protein JKG68_21585 [Microvirga aerilata]|uniref:Uncharacterized protein n=1 Tax=Microvirga aerilata TaxID=670292 RepID=A0A936ZL00_9HYPH|nr:hypothetical protein [Microvirga aerilata]MBL0406554.1 hypothetical protein [Microvirga aerilata]